MPRAFPVREVSLKRSVPLRDAGRGSADVTDVTACRGIPCVASACAMRTGFLGHWGDNHGRKQVLLVCMFLMGISTVGVGLLPTYEQAGLLAAALLVVLRLMQGFAVAGEISGASSMILEHAPFGKRGYYASFTLQGVQAGQVLAAAVFLPLAILFSLLMWGLIYQGYDVVYPSFYPELFPTRTRVSAMAISQNLGTAITAMLPALFAALAPPGSADIPLIVGSIAFGITIVAGRTARSRRRRQSMTNEPVMPHSAPAAASLDGAHSRCGGQTPDAGRSRKRRAPDPNRGDHSMSSKTLYERLGGYDAVAAVCENLLPRLQADPQLARFWQHRGEDGIRREKQLLIDFLCSSAGGPLYYTGRDMKVTHKGMKISESDWSAFIGHLNATLDAFQVPEAERGDVIAFVQSTKADMVEA